MSWKGTRPTAFADTIARDVGKKTRAAALQALSGVIERSPVGNPDLWEGPAPAGYIGGTFRGNNRVSVGTRRDTFDEASIDKNGGATLAAGNAVIASTRGAPFTVIYIQNVTPYAQALEDGWSAQTNNRPGGIYAITFNNLVEASR